MKKERLTYAIFIAVLCAGLLLRLIYFAQFRATPFYAHPTLDAKHYDRIAQEVAQGKLIRDEAFFFGPLYAYFLGLLYFLAGHNLWLPRIVQIILGLLNCYLVFLIGKKAFNSAVGLLGAILLVFYKVEIFYEQTLLIAVMAETLLLGFTCLILHSELPLKPPRSLIAGLILGVAALCRGNVLLIVPFFWLWILLVKTETSLKTQNRLWFRQKLPSALLFTLGVLLAILPATIHNYLAEKDLVLVSSNSGFNFYIGHNEKARGKFVLPEELDFDKDPSGRRIAMKALKKKEVKASEVSAYWRARAFEFIRYHPGKFLYLLATKFYFFWAQEDFPQIYNLKLMAGLTPLLKWPLVNFALIAPLALIGLGLCSYKLSYRQSLLALIIFAYVLSILPFFVTGRYRLAITPLIIIFSAWTLVKLYELFRFGKPTQALAIIITSVVLFLFLNNSGARNARAEFAQFHNELGLMYKEGGNIEKAMNELALAHKAYPKATYVANMGNVYYDNLHQYDKAIDFYEQAIKLNPDIARIYFNLAQAYLKKDDSDKAAANFEKALQLDKYVSPLAYYNLSLLHSQKENHEKAIELMDLYAELMPDDPHGFNLGIKFLVAAGRLAEAQTRLKEKLKRFPDHIELWYNLAVVYQRANDNQKAIKAYKEIIRLAPEHQLARLAHQQLQEITAPEP